MQLLASVLLAWSGAGPGDVEHIDARPKAGTAAAVVVPDAVPLVHTQQILATDGKPAATAKRLAAVLAQAGSSIDRIVKLNFVVADPAKTAALKKELASWTFGRGKPAVSFVQSKLPGGAAWAVD